MSVANADGMRHLLREVRRRAASCCSFTVCWLGCGALEDVSGRQRFTLPLMGAAMAGTMSNPCVFRSAKASRHSLCSHLKELAHLDQRVCNYIKHRLKMLMVVA